MELKKAILKMGVRLAFLPAVCAMTAAAETYVFNEALSGQSNVDWTLASSYSGTYSRNPTADDTVEIPAGVTAKVTAGSASWTLINMLTRIVPKDGAVFEVDVPGTYEGRAILGIPVTEYDLPGAENSGTLRKTGEGALELASYGKVKNKATICDYNLNLAVDGGDLYLYRDGTSDTEAFAFIDVTVAEGATLHPCYVGYTRLQNLDGSGAVVQDNPSVVQRTYLDGSGTSSFAGPLVGSKLRIDVTAGRHDFLCTTSSCFTICLSGNATCGITKFGPNNSTLSTLGTGNLNFGSNSGILYLGEGNETSAKDMWLGANTFLDAGAHGDFTLAGKMDHSGNSMFHVLSLGGSNEMPCVISGTIPGRADERNVYYLRKYGTGTWRMADKTNRGSLGVIDVEDGTLQFDTIAEKGSPCSLGYATNLFARATGVTYDTATRVGYAMVLGGDGTEGTLEYTGTAEGRCSTRPIAIRSNGRFASSAARYMLENVYALGAGDHTLTLAGAEGSVNRATHLADGTDGGVLNVVKEGAGTWELWGTNTFTGSLVSKGGRLVVNPEKKNYTWFRLTAKENGYSCPAYDAQYSVGTNADGSAKTIATQEYGFIQIVEVVVYDENGVNIAKNITVDDANYRYSAADGYAGLEPGYVCFGRTDSEMIPNGTRAAGTITSLDYLFNGDNKNLAAKFSCAYTTGPLLNDESTWIPIVFRLPASVTTTAVAMDIASGRNRTGVGSYNGRNLISFRFEGSTNGRHWDILFDDKDDVPIRDSYPGWLSNTQATGSNYSSRQGNGYDFQLDVTHQQSFTAVGAANGGVLEVQGEAITVSGLVIDAAESAGTISNVTFAASGTIDVLNAEGAASDVELPGDYSGLEGFSNLSSWQVNLDGEACRSRTVVVRDGKLFLVPLGIRFIVR